jgi:hypothetical protein
LRHVLPANETIAEQTAKAPKSEVGKFMDSVRAA